MIKKIVAIVCLIVLPFALQAQGLKKVKIEDTKMSIQVPTEFVAMIPEDIIQRFPSVRRPLAAYTSEDRMSELTVKISATKWGDNDLQIAQSFFKSSIMELFDKVEVLKEGISEDKRGQYIYFEFNSYTRGTDTSRPERKYNYITYRIKNLRTLVVSFRCPEREANLYKERVAEIMTTVKARKF